MGVLLAETVAACPAEPAVTDAGGVTIWSELDERVHRLIHALRDPHWVAHSTRL